jgi:hypothetical protein
VNIEQKLAFIRRAIELGANIEAKFHHIQTEAAASVVAQEMSEFFTDEPERLQHEGTKWFKLQDAEFSASVECVVFFKKQKEAVIDEPANAAV